MIRSCVRQSSTTSFVGSQQRVLFSSYRAKAPPSKETKSWERGAIAVKNVDVTNPYLEAIRDVHDPSMHLKSIEEELLGTMGKALGKQGEKVAKALRLMKQERESYERLQLEHNEDTKKNSATALIECAMQHNEYRKQAEKARWELIVHRQAIGCTVQNHRYIEQQYPIGPALPVTPEDMERLQQQKAAAAQKQQTTAKNKSTEEQFLGQLGWWERIGRWR